MHMDSDKVGFPEEKFIDNHDYPEAESVADAVISSSDNAGTVGKKFIDNHHYQDKFIAVR